ncbi:putative NERD domain protein [Desulfamplus magnetovallimortis]|uniref:Putative NERD domain protein n=1 Tax=Desulfamplus magnetovallimortis TaxID=1246637 RepID=A0A1W1HH92_9BACT|nr:NERD domain-containing protein/DEAD/DEAH box helicase [Desulfamplus magnetovallimortis]SLM31871.1 putative NERD domain protein [Desulfamplus magnetovallimortis]
MRMIPDSPYMTGSRAEYRVFDKLRESFVNDEACIAFHSFNLKVHDTKKFGEADFVILCESGIFVLEVKGGGVCVEDALWYTVDRAGERYRIQNPFRQAELAIHAIEKSILHAIENKNLHVIENKNLHVIENKNLHAIENKNLHAIENKNFHAIENNIENRANLKEFRVLTGYGVIFPDVEWSQNSAEWDHRIICDRRNMKNFESWLAGLFRYWIARPGNHHLLSPEHVIALKQFLRPDFQSFQSVETFYSSRLALVQKGQGGTKEDEIILEKGQGTTGEGEGRSEEWQITTEEGEGTSEEWQITTEDLSCCLNMISKNTRILCSGGAGTGKTFLAVELTKIFSNQNKLVLFLCKSIWLKRFLEAGIVNECVSISTIDSLSLDMRRAGIYQFDVLIVDEGHDIFNDLNMKKFDVILKGGLEKGEWYFFYDLNQFSPSTGLSAKKLLSEIVRLFKPARFEFGRNFRSTASIIKKVHKISRMNLRAYSIEKCPEIFETTVKIGADYCNAIESRIEDMLALGIPPASITILSPFGYYRSSISGVSEKTKRMIVRLDDFSVRYFPPSAISFARIKKFRGLENDAIIVIDLEHPEALCDVESKTNHYLAMSRARHFLCLLWCKKER